MSGRGAACGHCDGGSGIDRRPRCEPLANAPMSGEGCGVSGVITARSDGGGEELARVVESVWGLVAPCRGLDMLPVDLRIHGPAGRNGGAAGVCRYRWSKWLLRR
jgi:hypothetical protein